MVLVFFSVFVVCSVVVDLNVRVSGVTVRVVSVVATLVDTSVVPIVVVGAGALLVVVSILLDCTTEVVIEVLVEVAGVATTVETEVATDVLTEVDVVVSTLVDITTETVSEVLVKVECVVRVETEVATDVLNEVDVVPSTVPDLTVDVDVTVDGVGEIRTVVVRVVLGDVTVETAVEVVLEPVLITITSSTGRVVVLVPSADVLVAPLAPVFTTTSTVCRLVVV